MAKSTVEKRMDALEKRVAKIEKALFENGKKTKKKAETHEGLTGGINLLIEQGFFKKLVSVNEILDELKRENYIYSRQAVDIVLRRDFVKKKRVLTRIKEDGIWKYVIRK